MNRRGFLAFIGFGAVAQLAEHLPRKQTVLGSIPSGTSSKFDLLHAQGVRIGGNADPLKWTKSILPEV